MYSLGLATIAFAAPGWGAECGRNSARAFGNPETKGIQPGFVDNRLRENDLRSIAESVGGLSFAIRAILSDFGVQLTLKSGDGQVKDGKLNGSQGPHPVNGTGPQLIP
jgi:hypothetical protein